MKSLQINAPSMPNKHLNRLHKLLSEYRDVELTQFEGPGGKKAEFDDLLWHHVDPNTGRRTRYLCCRHGMKGKGELIFLSRPGFELPSPYDQLLKVWIIEVVNDPISAAEKQARVSIARKLLTFMGGDLYRLTEATVDNLKLGKHSNDLLRPFVKFCSGKGLMRELDLTSGYDRDRTGHAQLDRNLSKLPSIHAVLALGDIFKHVFENVNADGSVRPGTAVRMVDAIVPTFACLSLASPNRTAAEVTVLRKQRLHSYSENGGEPVYYLDWMGSKGHRDYKNHLLAALREPLEKSLNFFHDACEPARILCRFYENPNQSIKALLSGFKMAPERQQHLSPTTRPNIFQLGYALGFYGVDDCVHVLKEGADPTSHHSNSRAKCFEKKPIYSLTNQDQLATSRASPKSGCSYASLYYLFGVAINTWPFSGSLTVTVRDVQEWWISFFTKSLVPEFPVSYSTAETNIRLKDAMFCFLGNWFYGRGVSKGTGGKRYQSSPYAVVPLHALGSYAIPRLTGSTGKTIFEDYGFASEVRVRLHSLRHLANTLADMSEIPVEVITAWSGRVNPEQTHTYIHTGHDEKADRVRAVINPPSMDNRGIRVASVTRLSQATNLPASVTSTGVCTQDLNVTPCNFLNDFVAQCFMCPDSCHIAGDEQSVAFFEKDLAFQNTRLELVACDPRLSNSQAMKHWYAIHSRNTRLLSMLIDLMKKCPKGTIIRYSNNENQFQLTDLHTKRITKVACDLPDPEDSLKRLLARKKSSAKTCENPQLQSLLTSFGLAEKGA